MTMHRTHTQVGGWGLWPMIVPIGIGEFLLLLLHVCFLVHGCFFSCWWVCGGSLMHF